MSANLNCAKSDDRYLDSGLKIDEFSVLNENNVLPQMMNQPHFWKFNAAEGMKEHMWNGWNRPVWPWSLQCEQMGKTRRAALSKT